MRSPRSLQVEADPALMEQALVNLLLNARQADLPGGRDRGQSHLDR